MADNLLRAVEEFEFVWGTNKFMLGVSIGLVAIDSHFKRLAQVMNAADTACYSAKDSGRTGCTCTRKTKCCSRGGTVKWTGWRAPSARSREPPVSRGAADRPLLAARDATSLPHYELLLRMRDESGRDVPPGAFLPAVERYNLSVRYDRWVIATAIEWTRTHAEVVRARVAHLHQSLARQSITDPETAEFVRQSSRRAAWTRPARLRDRRERRDRQSRQGEPADRWSCDARVLVRASTTSAAACLRSPTSRR